MANLERARDNFKTLDELASRNTIIHSLHPVVKLITTLIFIISVASFHKYDLLAILPLILYPVVLINLGELPLGSLFKSMILALPFIFFVAIFNPLLDQVPLVQTGKFTITGGWISFLGIMLRFALTVLAALILIATSGMNEIGMALLKLKLPKPFVWQLLLLYRYLNLLISETIKTLRAYSLRALSTPGIAPGVWGSLVGQLLLRTIDRAQHIYQAMLSRGFTGTVRLNRVKRVSWLDLGYVLSWSGFFLWVRCYNIPLILGNLITGVGR